MISANEKTLANKRLLVFAKCPVVGRVKTRLIRYLGAATATQLYVRLLEHTLGQAIQLVGAERQLWLDLPTQHQDCVRRFAPYPVSLHAQPDGDLGERMYLALQRALDGAEKAVLIGTDCPDMHVEVLNGAFAALDATNAVFSPARDGGYVLIGLRKVHPDLFRGIPWSSGRVMTETRRRLERLGWTWRELPVLQDIDEERDLEHPFVRSAIATIKNRQTG